MAKSNFRLSRKFVFELYFNMHIFSLRFLSWDTKIFSKSQTTFNNKDINTVCDSRHLSGVHYLLKSRKNYQLIIVKTKLFSHRAYNHMYRLTTLFFIFSTFCGIYKDYCYIISWFFFWREEEFILQFVS